MSGIIMHIHKTGERCKRPRIITTPASYIRAGDMLERNGWHLYWEDTVRAYRVTDVKNAMYEFHNYNCAAAKFVELGE